jgi:hypothetical protein
MKNILSKQPRTVGVQMRFGIFGLIIGAGIYFGNVKFTFGKGISSTPSYSANEIIKTLSQIQNVT